MQLVLEPCVWRRVGRFGGTAGVLEKNDFAVGVILFCLGGLPVSPSQGWKGDAGRVTR